MANTLMDEAFINELNKIIDHDTHPPIKGPCEPNCVERAIERRIKELEA